MIIQSKENKTQASLVDLLGGNAKNTSTAKSNDLFSKLLNSFGMQTKNSDTSHDFKAIIDPKNNSSKNTSQLNELQTLLNGNEKKESALVTNELISTLSNDQVRTLINRAKDYLKNEITTKNSEYQADPKSLPKTLGGLVKLAEKLGLEPQAITLSTLITDPEEKASFAPGLLSKPLLETKALAALPSSVQEESPMEAITQLISELKAKEQKNSKTDSTAERSEKTPSDKLESQPLKALLQNLEKHEGETLSIAVSDKNDPIKISPSSSVSTNRSDMLIALLQGSNESKESNAETANTLKVEGESAKGMHALKSDSLEVKSKEAAQSMRYFASDLKEAVQEYKPPFTRLTMKLNPEKLGEVEVTLVQRGNNVHVNIQSNNANSVAFLAHNATELKAQLASQGITNATMNFMSGGDGQGNQQTGQQQQGQQQQQFRSYESFEELKLNEEQLSALEIIIPHYA